MMNKKTGHISVRQPGDYFLSFTANMVSVNSQAIWCAIYKQSSGNDAWQVLGMFSFLIVSTIFTKKAQKSLWKKVSFCSIFF